MSLAGRRIRIEGTVQGVGFRPWVYRLAVEAGLTGEVRNDAGGVTIEAHGPEASVEAFLERLRAAPPPAAAIAAIRWEAIGGEGPEAFAIVPSAPARRRRVSIPPDLATCADCLAEVEGPGDRRHRYPFTNCTNCGPRFTITLDVPYDRPVTTMAGFTMCPPCRREYERPEDRRFHAQPNACPDCGPRLRLASGSGEPGPEGDEALRRAARALGRGRIVALKGLGGFQLLVDARDGAAVARLRRRKSREEKPLALMVADLAAARRLCAASPAEEAVLASPAAPIVLIERLADAPVADEVAPGTPCLGVMLPYTPLHHLLLRETGFPVVATSGNLSDEPICIDNEEALVRLAGVADLFLLHDRPIARHADDSVVWCAADGVRPLRRARGYAPAPVALRRPVPPILAVGAHLKNAVAVTLDENVFISQHIGDMETPQACAAFEAVIADLLRMCRTRPEVIAHDLHPDYYSTRWARRAAGGEERPGRELPPGLAGARLLPVQHHHAHLASCLAENGLEGDALGVCWDGTGHGTDGTVWGGELLLGGAASFRRVARLRPFRLPGGDAAVRQPRRVALALLWELLGEEALERDDLPPVRAIPRTDRRLLGGMLARGIRSPLTSSAGRLFDGVSALLDLRQEVSFEGQAAMAVEFAAEGGHRGAYRLEIVPRPPAEPLPGAGELPPPGDEVLELDWRPMLAELLDDWRRGRGAGIIAARFHNALAAAIAAVARAVQASRVALSGGCFQSRLLSGRTEDLLARAGREVFVHRRVPANDGGISLGQAAAAAARLEAEARTS